MMNELLSNYEEGEISETELLEAISARVTQLMDSDPGLLFSYLYRLDVDESQLDQIITQPSSEPIAGRIATLILERQKARLRTKSDFDQSPPIEGWDW